MVPARNITSLRLHATDVAEGDESLDLPESEQEVPLDPQAVSLDIEGSTTTDSVSSAFSLQASFILEVCEDFESKLGLPYIKAVLLTVFEMRVRLQFTCPLRGVTSFMWCA